MPAIRIRIGASTDSSVATAFSSIEKAAARSAAVIKKELGNAMSALTKGGAGSGLAKVAAENKKAADDTARAMGTLALGAAAKFKQLQAGLKAIPADLRTVAQEAQRAMQQMEREKARAALGLPGVGRNNIYWHPTSWATIRKPNLKTINADPIASIAGFGMGAASFMKRTMMGMAGSMGVETSLGSYIQRNISEEAVAQGIVNAGYFPGETGPKGVKANRGDILAETRNVAIGTGTERGEVLEGLRDFVGKTGELQLGRDILADMAKLSKATDSNMADMINAAGEVSNALGDVPNKAGVINEVMRQIAGQGKLGAVEIRDLATQMAKLASQAGKFEGGAQKNIAILGMLAQEAKIGGGATNATQATTSVARFVDSLTKGNTLRAMRGYGLTPFTDASHTALRDPREIIKDVIHATRGDIQKIQQVMPGSIGLKPVQGLAAIYRRTGGDEAHKMAAVVAAMGEFERSALTASEVDRAFAETMETTKSKTTVFNEKMAAIAEKLAGPMAGALDRLGPAFLQLANTALPAAASGFTFFVEAMLWAAGAVKDGLVALGIIGKTPEKTPAQEAHDMASRSEHANALEAERQLQNGRAPGLWQPSAAAFVPGLGGQMMPGTFDYSTVGLLTPGALQGMGAGAIKRRDFDVVQGEAGATGTDVAKKEADLAAIRARQQQQGSFWYRFSHPFEELGAGAQAFASGKSTQSVLRDQARGTEQDLASLKDLQGRQLGVLEAIREAIESGREGWAAPPSTTPAVPPPSPVPAGVKPVSDGAEGGFSPYH